MKMMITNKEITTTTEAYIPVIKSINAMMPKECRMSQELVDSICEEIQKQELTTPIEQGPTKIYMDEDKNVWIEISEEYYCDAFSLYCNSIVKLSSPVIKLIEKMNQGLIKQVCQKSYNILKKWFLKNDESKEIIKIVNEIQEDVESLMEKHFSL